MSNEHNREVARFARDAAAKNARRPDAQDPVGWIKVYWTASIVMARERDFESYMP